MRLVPTALASLLLAALLLTAGGCGDDEDVAIGPEVASRTARVAGLEYRLTLFRQLNPRIEPDATIYAGPPPARTRLLYGAFLRVCNRGDGPVQTSGRILLRDALGQTFAPDVLAADPFAYRGGTTVEAGTCVPEEGSPAARSIDGLLLPFELPVEAVRDRPHTLVVHADGELGRLAVNPSIDDAATEEPPG